MKKILMVFLTASVVLIACDNKGTSKVGKKDSIEISDPASPGNAVMSFEKHKYDFGKIHEGEKVSHEFKFTNRGTEPLIISKADATCGCTVPEYPNEPIAPDKDGIIKVVFNSAGQFGTQYKRVVLVSDANPSTTEIYLTGEVLDRKK